MNQTKADGMVSQLPANAADLRYGVVSVTAKLHDGQVVTVSYSRTEHTREQENKESENEPLVLLLF